MNIGDILGSQRFLGSLAISPQTGDEPNTGGHATRTDIHCGKAKPKDKPFKLADGNGLYLEVKPNEVKAWRDRFEFFREGGRKESVFAIGDYAHVPTLWARPDMTRTPPLIDPPDRRRWRNAEAMRRRASRQATVNRQNQPYP